MELGIGARLHSQNASPRRWIPRPPSEGRFLWRVIAIGHAKTVRPRRCRTAVRFAPRCAARCYLLGGWLARAHEVVRVEDQVVHHDDLVLL